MALKIYNTQTHQKEEFHPQVQGKVGMYVCGVTTYDRCHLGHARAAVAFDLIVRHLRSRFNVTFVRNITDIDDKIINRARELNEPWDHLTKRFTDLMHADFKQLNILPPDIEPKATDHIPQMLQIIENLIQKGLAYASEGDVFYSVRSFNGYGKLSGKNLEDLMAGARVGIDEKKQDPLDFALWKAAKPGEPAWDSPWGKGRPGWHIECSAMAMKYLGEHLDIHGGGRDLIFPHHENEIAQSEGTFHTHDKPFVRYWLHNGFVTINKEKMSKSLGNFFSIAEILEKFEAETVRLFLLSSHYRGPIDFSDEHLREAHARCDRVYQFKQRLAALSGGEKPGIEMLEVVHRLPEQVVDALDDDFNTPDALAAIFEMIRKVNIYLDAHPQTEHQFGDEVLRKLQLSTETLAVFQKPPEVWFRGKAAQGIDAAMVEAKIQARNQARKDKHWAQADALRKELDSLGIVLEDTAQGTTWKVVKK